MNIKQIANSYIDSINFEFNLQIENREYLGYDNHLIENLPNYVSSFSFIVNVELSRHIKNTKITRLLVELNKSIDTSKNVYVIDSSSLFSNKQTIHLFSK